MVVSNKELEVWANFEGKNKSVSSKVRKIAGQSHMKWTLAEYWNTADTEPSTPFPLYNISGYAVGMIPR